ncbi:uncharacterized protein LOC121428881 [Lytechinus variegatus]|uniref:uncharacterized protein LOC121428881 n=1 Tax=Lytechinus variegatus TaxID=7654 RepID=UPI001BB1B1E8|nr:uncharacterized protein LOC121428881 [Lytechinus variegatus]
MSSSAVSDGECEHKTRTILWCMPRSVSTALTKCLSFTPDTQVWFEPYCYCFLARREIQSRQHVDLPTCYHGNEHTFHQAASFMNESTSCRSFKAESLSYNEVKKSLESWSNKHVFVKDIAFSIGENERPFLPTGFKHTFLIRHPLRSFYSQRKMMFEHCSKLGLLTGEAADESTYDLERHNHYMTPGLFIKDVYDLWKYIRENVDSNPIVMDGDDLLANPSEMLPKYCRAVGLPYEKSRLTWDASLNVVKTWKLPADDLLENIVAWYGTATRSSGFKPANRMPSRDEVTQDVIRCTDQVLPFYEEMYEHRMKV